MRTNIEIDDELMAEAMKALGTKTKRETVEEALRRYVQIMRQREMLKLRGKLEWSGDLEAMRVD
ncbi:Transcription regulator of the Arc/MetJ class [Sphingomonas sp. OV641]|uniref:type II toxin-antitoxin system VapB family antitoxin n=1 Tax=Sphingomonas sp. OV641 TaxID=1881068 RepID=UPI0008D540FF|nr:type II toxin-antitoxin system VapB family antitoxin [Sphingomonas sp. OV641]SEJ16924.1 Transcription regulator of the Arc/MetJ class [Sphingomonas sp. OV641]